MRPSRLTLAGTWCAVIGALLLQESVPSLAARPQDQTSAAAPGRQRILIRSTSDGSLQPSYLIVPASYDPKGAPTPVVVALHTWSFDLEQRLPTLEAEAAKRNWIYLFPNFRGVDDHPEACGSDLAQQDVLDAVSWTRAHLNVDAQRVYLVGWSGGGHMALVMAGRAPALWKAVSAWAAITDLAVWYRELEPDRSPVVSRQIRACVGGAPGESAEVDRQYRARSPINTIARAAAVPVDLWTGIHDGHAPPGDDVTVAHSLATFNVLARAAGVPLITPAELEQLRRADARLTQPRPGDRFRDPVIGRDVYLRRSAGASRVTVYEGHHELHAPSAFEWFDKHGQ